MGAGEPLPLLWTADFIPVDGHVAPMVVGEFNCSCVGISAFLKACGPDKDLKDVSFSDFEYGMKLTNLIGKKVVETLDELKAKTKKPLYPLTLLPAPKKPKYNLVVIGYTAPGGWEKNTDKDITGFRYDSTPIANGCILSGAACDLMDYTPADPKGFEEKMAKYDGIIVRINPGQLGGGQQVFDDLMMSFVKKGVPVWSSPAVQTQLGAKDALVKIKDMNSGLPDTRAYYDEAALIEGFKKTCAFQPRVIKQNRGSAGEGIWLCWLEGKDYCKNYGDAMLNDGDKLKLMEMNDNHVEHHTVAEFLEFCVSGPGGKAGEWKSTFPGKYLEGGKEAGGQLVDQRLCPRIKEGEVRVLMVGDECQMIIHKMPTGGGLSAVGGNSDYTFYEPDDPKYSWLYQSIKDSLPKMMPTLGLEGEGLPILWTTDFIPKDPEAGGEGTEYVVGEFNCSCVGISKFQAKCGGSVADVSDEDYADGIKLTNMIGRNAVDFVVRKKIGA